MQKSKRGVVKEEWLKDPDHRKRHRESMIWIRKQGFATISDFARSIGAEYGTVAPWLYGRKPRPVWARIVLDRYPECPFVQGILVHALPPKVKVHRSLRAE